MTSPLTASLAQRTAPGIFGGDGLIQAFDGAAGYRDMPDNVVRMLWAAAVVHGDREALAEVGGDRFTYGEMWSAARRVAGGLRGGGVRRGDRVAIRLGNSADWALAFVGTLLAGAIAVPVNVRLTDAEVDYIVGDSGAAYVFRAGAALPGGEPVQIDDQESGDTAAILYTSGTTGSPKGVVLTHRNLVSATTTMRRILAHHRLPEHARDLVAVPLFHVTALTGQFLPTLASGGALVVLPAFDVITFLDTVEAERIDSLVGVPTIFALAAAHPHIGEVDVSSVKWVGFGGAAATREVIAAITAAFPGARLTSAYGMTETSGPMLVLPTELITTRPESVGFPPPVWQARIDRAGVDGIGELLVRGEGLMRRYWNNPDATAAALEDGWLHTGDLARSGTDGTFVVVGRITDMIIRGGENVYCLEVEQAIGAEPGVQEVAVVGVPDPVMGEKVAALILPRPGAELDVPVLLDRVKTRLADFKVPQYVAIAHGPLPRNANGKLLKKQIKADTEWGREIRH